MAEKHVESVGEVLRRQSWAQNERPAPIVDFPIRQEFQCRNCDDTGYVVRTRDSHHPDFGKAFLCSNPECPTANEIRERQYRRLFKDSGIPDGYQNFSFQSFDALPDDLKKGKMAGRLAMQMYVERKGTPFALCELYELLPEGRVRDYCYHLYKDEVQMKQGVVLAGTNGTGKTGLIASAQIELVKRGTPVLFMNALGVLGAIKATYDAGGTSALKDNLKNSNHLFIDEMTFETNEWRRTEMQEILRHRHGNDLPIVMTTNFTVQEFESTFHSQTATGVLAKAHWLEVGGTVLRHERHSVSEVF